MGFNLEKIEKGEEDGENSDFYAINLFLRRYAADKSDGKVYAMQTGDSTVESVKSFPLTEEEFSSLLEE